MAVAGSGDVFACDFGNAAVMRVSTAGEVSTYSNGTAERPMRVPNFAAFDDGGNLYVTDSGEWGDDDGLVYRIAPGGATETWTEATPRFPNGCCLTADGDALLVIESHGRAVVRVPIRDDGSAGPPEPVVDLSGSQPDGIALAEDGTMFVGCYRPDRVYRIPRAGPPRCSPRTPTASSSTSRRTSRSGARTSIGSSSRASGVGASSRPRPAFGVSRSATRPSERRAPRTSAPGCCRPDR